VSAVGHEIDVTLVDLVADVRAATPSQAAELVIPDSSARLEMLARCRRQLLRAMAGSLRVQRSEAERLRMRLGDPRFLLVERQQHLDELGARLERFAGRQIGRRRGELGALERRLSLRHPRAVLADARGALAPLGAELESAMRLRLGRARRELEKNVARLDGLSPLAVLARGYAIALTSDGRALRAASETAEGEELRLRLHSGELGVGVVRVKP
jgi:exodeoxyribonuclease VII large subunit